jgi:predicted nucleic acid-binding protein
MSGAGAVLAEQLGIPVVGLIGVLLMARGQQLITRLRPHLDDLRNLAGFCIAGMPMNPELLWSGPTPANQIPAGRIDEAL